MEIELVSPAFVVPEDIEIGVRHFLTVPSGNSSNTDHRRDKIHRVVKLTKTASGFEIEHIDTKSKVSSGYFQTKNFVGKSLCHITTTATAECIHASVKKFYVTQHQKNCPHTKFSLSLFCVCVLLQRDYRGISRDKYEKYSIHVCTQSTKSTLN